MSSHRDGDAFDVQSWLKSSKNGRGHNVKFTQPKQVNCWTKTSANEGSKFLMGDSTGLPAFQPPQLPADLNEGYPDAFIRKDETALSPIEPVIEAACLKGVKWERYHVCSYRNNLNKITMTPLNQDEQWEVDGCLWGSTLFLDIRKSAQRSFPDSDRFTYYGYKFEAVCSGDASEVDATSEYGAVVEYRFGGLRILMGCEIDCQDPNVNEPNPIAAYMELKTFKLPRNSHQEGNMARTKYPRWWVQSFLAGVPTLVLGGRDDKGVLREVRRVSVQQLPDLAAQLGQNWDAFELLAFTGAVLEWMRAVAARGPEGQHWRFSYTPDTRCITASAVPSGTFSKRLADKLSP